MSYLHELVKQIKSDNQPFEYDGFLVTVDDTLDVFFVYREFSDDLTPYNENAYEAFYEDELFSFFLEEISIF